MATAKTKAKSKTKATNEPKADVYERITASIIEALESGVAPWACPWVQKGPQRNGATGRRYSGVNVLATWVSSMLNSFDSNEWYTFKQASELGGTVKKGSKGTVVAFYSTLLFDADGNRLPANADRDLVKSEKLFAKANIVFNRDQIEGLPASEFVGATADDIQHDWAERLMEASGADLEIAGDRAYFSPIRDKIVMPEFSRFTGEDALEQFWATAFHELTHWTGHESRLNRPVKNVFGSPEYSKEELIAELGAAFLCAEAGFSAKLNHAEYIADWLSVLKNDKKFVFSAAAAAQKSTNYLLSKLETKAPSDESEDDLAKAS